MSICKYCGQPIEGEPVMNPDEYGDGYHHFCLVDKEFREEQRQIYNKGKADVLDTIRAEIEARLCDVVSDYTDGYRTAIQGNLAIIDKYRKEQT